MGGEWRPGRSSIASLARARIPMALAVRFASLRNRTLVHGRALAAIPIHRRPHARRLPIRRGEPKRRVPSGLVAVALIPAATFAGPLLSRDRALATAFRIETPTSGSSIGDGNLLLVEIVAPDSQDGVVHRVEIAVDTGSWEPAERSRADAARWRFLWMDPSPGSHQIRARAFGGQGHGPLEQNVGVEVVDRSTTPFIVDNPYATPGSFRKGQLHTHSTRSFDGWDSLPPGELALAYMRRGYQFVAITDHDNISYPAELNSDSFLALPGYESTAESGHITGLFVRNVAPQEGPAQERLDHIRADGGMAILNHPTYSVGWAGTDLETLQGCFAIELFNGITSNEARAARATRLWHDMVNARNYRGRVWAVAVDDAHSADAIDNGWVMLKTRLLTQEAVRQSLERGAFYASNGPTFGVLGVLNGAITASSPDAATIRFIDQDMNVLHKGPPGSSAYLPRGTERWIRVEAASADGRTAWSQPFWLMPNAPRVEVIKADSGTALAGQTLPGGRVDVYEGESPLGTVVANERGDFAFTSPRLAHPPYQLSVLATSRWPDQLTSPRTAVAALP